MRIFFFLGVNLSCQTSDLFINCEVAPESTIVEEGTVTDSI
jgi:hypothetical protein